jgi:hypothetical protein
MAKRTSGSVLLLATLALTLIAGDVLVLIAQDPPGTPPTQPQTQPQPPTKQKAGSKKKAPPKVMTTEATPEQPTPQEPAMPAQEAMPATPAQTAATSPTEQTDLSGTYAGTFNCDALGLTGDTTLTITGNQFTTADGKSGRIIASTTRGYTAVALQVGEIATGATTTPAATATAPTIVSMRARRSRDRLTLTSVPGAAMQCSFQPARNVARTRRSRQRTPAATGTEVSNPAAMPNPTEPAQPSQPMPSQTPSPSPSPTPSPTPAPTPEPVPSPAPSPMPTPVPSPSGTPAPDPSPSPTATPSPTPTPSPSPRPRG